MAIETDYGQSNMVSCLTDMFDLMPYNQTWCPNMSFPGLLID